MQLTVYAKPVVEPAGCLGQAAALEMKSRLHGLRIGVIIRGGNVDMKRFCGLSGA